MKSKIGWSIEVHMRNLIVGGKPFKLSQKCLRYEILDINMLNHEQEFHIESSKSETMSIKIHKLRQYQQM